eukprot:gene3993-14073_t
MEGAAGTSAALDASGERFMSMFDDYGVKKPKQKKGKSSSKTGALSQLGIPSTSGSLPQEEGKGGASRSNGVLNGKAAAMVGPSSGVKKRKAAGGTEIEDIMQRLLSAKTPPGGKQQVSSSKSVSTSSSGLSIDLRAERKAFMSSKPEKVHEEVDASASRNGTAMRGRVVDADAEENMGHMTRDDFKQLQLEVERLGASELDKKEKKKWQATMLQRIGAKAEKGPRMGSKIGMGIAKKRLEREEKALQEAIAAGHVKKKGIGKKKREEKEKNRDKGLMEAGQNFKGGVLRLKK